MKIEKLLLLLTMGLFIGAAPAALVDDFTSDSLDPAWVEVYLLSRGQNGYTYDTTTNDNELTITGDNSNAEQWGLLRDDFSLQVGQKLVVDLVGMTDAGTEFNAGIMIHTSTGVGLDDISGASPSNTLQDRLGYLTMSWRSNGTDALCEYFNSQNSGTQLKADTGGERPVKLWIIRESADTYTAGWTMADGIDRTFGGMPVTVNAAPGAAVGFYTDMRTAGSAVFDNLKIVPVPMATAHSPIPDGSEYAAASGLTMSWAPSEILDETDPNNPMVQVDPDITGYYLYIDILDEAGDPNFADTTPISVARGAGSRDESTGYNFGENKFIYWRVDESVNGSAAFDDPNTITGPVWSFETVKTVPEITGQPADAVVGPGETAEFTVEAELAVGSITYQWYNSSGPMSGETAATLQIVGATDNEEDAYYCVVGNGSGGDVQSESATLTVKTLLAHYEFSDNVDDSVGTNHGTVKDVLVSETPAVEYVASPLGKAVDLDGGDYIELSTDAFPKIGVGNGLSRGTIVTWIRIDDLDNSDQGVPRSGCAIIGGENDNDGTQLVIGGTSNSMEAWSRPQTGDDSNRAIAGSSLSSLVGDSEFHMIVATFEPGQPMKLYIDGRLADDSSNDHTDDFSAWDKALTIGARFQPNETDPATRTLDGAVDDIKIYDYAKTEIEIIELYNEASDPDIYLCDENFPAELDITGDCQINLADFVEIANVWLTCGRVPTSTCD